MSMKLLVLYRPNSEHARVIETFLRDFQREYTGGLAVEVQSLDTREGASTASIYDVVRYPGLLVLDNFGSVVRSWQGDELPQMAEIIGAAT